MDVRDRDRYIDRYISLDELNNGYIKLSDFIKNARFIGREFKRIGPGITYYGIDRDMAKIRDSRYLEIDEYGYDDKYIVLYEKDNTFKVRYICGNSRWYGIVDCIYIQDGMYKFIGPVYEEYRDKEKVYLEIVEQIDSYTKKNVKT